MRDIYRLDGTGLTMTSKSLTNKLASWEDCLYMSVEKIREGWEHDIYSCHCIAEQYRST